MSDLTVQARAVLEHGASNWYVESVKAIALVAIAEALEKIAEGINK